MDEPNEAQPIEAQPNESIDAVETKMNADADQSIEPIQLTEVQRLDWIGELLEELGPLLEDFISIRQPFRLVQRAYRRKFGNVREQQATAGLQTEPEQP